MSLYANRLELKRNDQVFTINRLFSQKIARFSLMLKRKVVKLLAEHISGGTSFSHQGGSLADLPDSVLLTYGQQVPDQEVGYLLKSVTPGLARLPGMLIDVAAFRVPR